MSSVVTEAIDYLSSARRVFEIEAHAVAALSEKLDGDFQLAIEHILRSRGRLIVCGMGKSGIIARKIAATLASTGTPAFFMHPGEAYHGDLGMVSPEDVFVALSFSGETDEVVKLLPFLKENGNFVIAITGNPRSTLARAAACHLNVAIKEEACPLRLAPTTSTTVTLAMGDALAVALMEARGFRAENFAKFHPGGSLGRRLLSRVQHEMVSSNLPFVEPGAQVMDVISAITLSSLGLAIVQCGSDFGIITDGDVRRAIEAHGKAVFELAAADIMTLRPASVMLGTRVEDAIALMERRNISSLLVFDGVELKGVFKK